MKTFDLDSFSRCIGIAAGKLRFGQDYGMAERDWNVPEDADGTTKQIDVIAAVHLACGAWLLESGLALENAKALMKVIGGIKRRVRNPLHLPIISEAIHGTSSAVVQIADGRFIRWKIGLSDTGWISFDPSGAEVECHEPTAVIALDVARIRDLLQRAEL